MEKCKTCGGRGRWQEQETDTVGTVLVWLECNDCRGTGISQNPEAGEDFDIDGSNNAEED